MGVVMASLELGQEIGYISESAARQCFGRAVIADSAISGGVIAATAIALTSEQKGDEHDPQDITK